MATDHEERKHRRTSDDESEEPSKRRKHRHHRRRHHRHHTRKHEEETTEMPPPPPVDLRNDYDMEEGEIVEEDDADDLGKKKIADSDAESGEIETEIHGVPDHSLSLPLDADNSQSAGGHLKDVDHKKNGSKTKEHTDNGYMKIESQKGSGNRKSHHDDDGYETRDCTKPPADENHIKAHKHSSSKHVHERGREDVPTTSRSRSHLQVSFSKCFSWGIST